MCPIFNRKGNVLRALNVRSFSATRHISLILESRGLQVLHESGREAMFKVNQPVSRIEGRGGIEGREEEM